MKRREFVGLFGGWVGLAVRRARAADNAGDRISRQPIAGYDGICFAVVLARLGRMGLCRRKNVAIEYRWAEDRYDRLPAMAAELVRDKVAVIVASEGNVSPLAAKAATATIPIVFPVVTDPVKGGLVESFNRPGGNVTGIAMPVINLKTARAIGLTVPPSLIARADEVIE